MGNVKKMFLTSTVIGGRLTRSFLRFYLRSIHKMGIVRRTVIGIEKYLPFSHLNLSTMSISNSHIFVVIRRPTDYAVLV